MKALLDHRFAPVTFEWGFVESSFAQFSGAFIQWHDRLDAKFGTRTDRKTFQAPLSESLLALNPLTSPLDRYLLTETRSGWTAIFANGLRGNDVYSPVSYLPTVLGCRGLAVACVPDRSDSAGRDEVQIYGAVKFALYGPNETGYGLNTIRSISVANDVSGWEFTAGGEVQLFEQPENYRKRRVVDRFTPEMLESYCGALGIELFNADFYGGQCLVEHTTNRAASAQGPIMSIAEARSHLSIPG
jgi:hypothetical protein